MLAHSPTAPHWPAHHSSSHTSKRTRSATATTTPNTATAQGLEEARPEGEEAALPGAGGSNGSLAAVGVDVATVLAFLAEGGQLAEDAVARDLDASQVGG